MVSSRALPRQATALYSVIDRADSNLMLVDKLSRAGTPIPIGYSSAPVPDPITDALTDDPRYRRRRAAVSAPILRSYPHTPGQKWFAGLSCEPNTLTLAASRLRP